MDFGKYDREKFYKTLLNLRTFNPALSANASFRKVDVGDSKAVYAYVRENGSRKVLVILNLSASPQEITIDDEQLQGEAFNVFRRNVKEPITNKPRKMDPWGVCGVYYRW